MKYIIATDVDKSTDMITQVVASESMGQIEVIQTRIILALDEQVRAGLIQLGWTPPFALEPAGYVRRTGKRSDGQPWMEASFKQDGTADLPDGTPLYVRSPRT